jgi:hypothetical protein
VVQLGWEFSLVTYPGFTPVGNATLVVANVLTRNKHSPFSADAGVAAAAGAAMAEAHSVCGIQEAAMGNVAAAGNKLTSVMHYVVFVVCLSSVVSSAVPF